MSIYFNNKVDEIQYHRYKDDCSLADFKKSDLVSLIYYPYQNFPAPHAALEIEGRCYSFFWCMRACVDLTDKMSHSEVNTLQSKPFLRIGISMSFKELEKLKNKVNKSYYNITCMQAISSILLQSADFYIPFPLSISPTLSVGYLCAKKAFGSSRITSITPYPSLSSLQAHHPARVSMYIAKVCASSCLSIGTELFIFYNLPKIVFEKSHLVRAIRMWAANRFSGL